MKQFRIQLWIQSLYILITAVWPLIDIDTFMAVTGPKTDIWLVKTVGAILLAVAITMITHLFTSGSRLPVIVLCLTTATALTFVDFYYALRDVISEIYIVDGVLELIFIGGWLYMITFKKEVFKNG
jgi:hypothetical protein